MELTIEQKINFKSQALEASLKLESLYPYKPIVMMDINKLPENFSVEEWIEKYKSGMVWTLSNGEPKVIDLGTENLLERATKIYQWLTDSQPKTANGTNRG